MIINIIKGLHILAVIAWMAGLRYLPRLFAYHTRAAPGSETDATFQAMERGLLNIIMQPASLAVLFLGGTLVALEGVGILATSWMIVKLVGVGVLFGLQHFLGQARKRLALGHRDRSERFWRMINELPFVAAIIIVLAVTTKFAV